MAPGCCFLSPTLQGPSRSQPGISREGIGLDGMEGVTHAHTHADGCVCPARVHSPGSEPWRQGTCLALFGLAMAALNAGQQIQSR